MKVKQLLEQLENTLTDHSLRLIDYYKLDGKLTNKQVEDKSNLIIEERVNKITSERLKSI